MKTEAEYAEQLQAQVRALNRLLEEAAPVLSVNLRVAHLRDPMRGLEYDYLEWAKAGFAAAALWARDPVVEMLEAGQVKRDPEPTEEGG